MGNLGGYNENEIEVGGFDDLPNGEYKVYIDDTEVRQSKTGNDYISVDMIVAEGPYEGRHHFENLNVYHSNPDVVAIAHRNIKKMSMAMGITGVKDHEDLRFDNHKNFMVLSIKDGKKEGTKFIDFKSAEGFVSAPANKAEEPKQAGAKPSWAR